MFKHPLLYIQFRSDWIWVRNVRNGATASDSTRVVVDGDGKVIAVGGAAVGLGPSFVNGFAEGPPLISDLKLAAAACSPLIRRVCWNGVFALKRDIVLHPLDYSGSVVSESDFRDLAALLGAIGCYRGYVHVGPELDREEVQLLIRRGKRFGSTAF